MCGIRGNERIQQELQELAPIRSAADRLVTQCCGVKARKKLWMFVIVASYKYLNNDERSGRRGASKR